MGGVIVAPEPPQLLEQSWAKDEKRSFCMNCGQSFTLMRRRHHCRCCGEIFCSDCWGFKCVLKLEWEYNPGDAVKVCNACAILNDQCRLLRDGVTVEVVTRKFTVAPSVSPSLSESATSSASSSSAADATATSSSSTTAAAATSEASTTDNKKTELDLTSQTRPQGLTFDVKAMLTTVGERRTDLVVEDWYPFSHNTAIRIGTNSIRISDVKAITYDDKSGLLTIHFLDEERRIKANQPLVTEKIFSGLKEIHEIMVKRKKLRLALHHEE